VALSAVWPAVEVFDDHRQWRPEWTVDRTCLYWYLTFTDQPDVASLAQRAGGDLGTHEAIDPVPPPWLHLTLCDVGFLDEVGQHQLEVMTEAVAHELRLCSPFELSLGPIALYPDALTLAAGPHSRLRELRNRIERAMESADLNPRHHPADQFWPHVTLGYLNRRAEMQPVLDTLGDEDATGTVTVRDVTLAAVSRRHGYYQWDAGAVISLQHGAGPVRRQVEGTGEPSSTGSESTP
jgi:2'-5' RNA ligase